ncbi:hypothetical protein [Inconstantimicrobium mannanitabidum]|uniref:Uncharacterized protein n=1 Tax=Inconstantimicrobium mannanitabidum TaxID=1604901 RepID=A0ACB5R9M1_9CLOT|nr:hypothetical protein [Clostridium sp. TW13]GKX65888.1 hypothetical protein rsdtw13_11460 [Clostridium sp. TW13]
MVDLKILNGLSFIGAVAYLIEARYIECESIKQNSDECDVICLYPYILYDENNCMIDKVYHAEYCMIDEDGDLNDFKTKWIRM